MSGHGPVSIRLASGRDIDALMALTTEHAIYERLASPPPERRIDLLVAALEVAPPRLHAWLAQAGDVAVGYASATLDFSTLARAPYLHMDCLFVRSAWRNHAIGQQLWQAVRHFAQSRGCRRIEWQTPEWNIDAARFYRRLGAQECLKRRYTFALAPDR